MELKHTLSFPIEDMEPNQLGEFLRAITFVGEGYGCYENFNVRKDAHKWSDDELKTFVKNHFLSTNGAQPYGYTYRKDGLLIDVFWYWDGDGDLIFRIRTKDNKVVRMIRNTDGKKDYTWYNFTHRFAHR